MLLFGFLLSLLLYFLWVTGALFLAGIFISGYVRPVILVPAIIIFFVISVTVSPILVLPLLIFSVSLIVGACRSADFATTPGDEEIVDAILVKDIESAE